MSNTIKYSLVAVLVVVCGALAYVGLSNTDNLQGAFRAGSGASNGCSNVVLVPSSVGTNRPVSSVVSMVPDRKGKTSKVVSQVPVPNSLRQRCGF